MSDKTKLTTKLRSAPTQRRAQRNKGRYRRVNLWLTSRSEGHLAEVRGRYEAILDRPVSTSLAMRRGLAILADHLAATNDPAQVKAELAELIHHTR